MEPLPVLMSLTFILTTGLAVGLLYHAAYRSKRLLWVLLAWLLVQGGLAGSGFYAVTIQCRLVWPWRWCLPCWQ